MPQTLELIEVESSRLDDVLRRVEQSLDEEDSLLIRRVFESYAYVSDLVEDRNTSIRRLRELRGEYGWDFRIEVDGGVEVGARGFEVFLKCFERGVLVRVTGDTIALSPPLIIEPKHVARIVETLAAVIRETA